MTQVLPAPLADTLSGVALRSPSVARPIIKWAGGKRSLLPDLLALAPRRFRVYYEPFLGGASYFLGLGPPNAVLSDANSELMQLYETVRDHSAELIHALAQLQPHVSDSETYYSLRSQEPQTLSAVDRAARFIFLNKSGYNGLYRVNRRGEFNVPFGRHETPPRLCEEENFLAAASMFRHAQLLSDDFEDVLEMAGEGDFAYLDPPYVPLTATANFTGYTSGRFSEDDQIRLARAVHRAVDRGCRVLLSNSDTPLVRELYERYTIHVLYASRAINSDGAKRQKVSEIAVEARPQ